MPKLATPLHLGLTDPEGGREADRLHVTFELAPDATSYELSLNGIPWPTAVMPGDFIEPLHANATYALSVIARAAGFDDSDPSQSVSALTRPPVPTTLRRVPIDLNGWGIVLEWEEPRSWHGATAATVVLRRSDDKKPSIAIARAPLTFRHVDTQYPLNGEKAYDLVIVVSDPAGGPPNLSRPGVPVLARGPIQANAVGTVNQPLAAARQRSERAARALLGLRY